jgi:hypothetical protein
LNQQEDYGEMLSVGELLLATPSQSMRPIVIESNPPRSGEMFIAKRRL